MFNLPPLPRVYNTRHLSCVACKEKFVAAEGFENTRREISQIMPNVLVHYEDNRRQLPVLPSPHLAQQPTLTGVEALAGTNYKEINCPRCGADNRNWLHLNNNPKKTFLSSFESWQKRMPGIALLIVLAIALCALTFIFYVFGILPRAHVILLAFTIPVAILGTFWDLTRKWKKYREDKYLYEYKLIPRKPELILQLRGIFLIFFFSFFLPLLFVSLLPRGFNIALAIIRETPEQTVQEAMVKAELTTTEQLAESKAALEEVSNDLQTLLSQFPASTTPQFEQELDTLSNELESAVTDATKALEQSTIDNSEAMAQLREDELAQVATIKESALAEFRKEFLVELRYLIIWGGLLGIATLLSLTISFSNLEKFIASINAHLPLPIFHSVAGMSRLVTWEAKRALEIQGKHVERIQWISVDRNDLGGIDLVGLFRDPPEFDALGRVKSDLVRAQKHSIHTDRWCRVISAKIDDVMVPIPAGAPAGSFQLAHQSEHDAPQEVRIRLQN